MMAGGEPECRDEQGRNSHAANVGTSRQAVHMQRRRDEVARDPITGPIKGSDQGVRDLDPIKISDPLIGRPLDRPTCSAPVINPMRGQMGRLAPVSRLFSTV